MPEKANPAHAEVFISYASADRDRVLPIANRLTVAGVSVWLDRYKIEGAARWAEEIVRGIEACKVFLLMCSDASMRSWAVKQELQLAGECQKRLLPLIIQKPASRSRCDSSSRDGNGLKRRIPRPMNGCCACCERCNTLEYRAAWLSRLQPL